MILVVGVPRSRTSLLMQTLKHLGKDVIGDFVDSEMNPRGNGECAQTSAGVDTAEFEDGAMKVMVDAFLFRSRLQPTDRIIYCLRSPGAVSRSQGETGVGRFTPETRRWNYWRLTAQFQLWRAANPNPVLIVETDELVQNPGFWVSRIAEFVAAKPTREAIDNVSHPLTHFAEDSEVKDAAQTVYEEMRNAALLHHA